MKSSFAGTLFFYVLFCYLALHASGPFDPTICTTNEKVGILYYNFIYKNLSESRQLLNNNLSEVYQKEYERLEKVGKGSKGPQFDNLMIELTRDMYNEATENGKNVVTAFAVGKVLKGKGIVFPEGKPVNNAEYILAYFKVNAQTEKKICIWNLTGTLMQVYVQSKT